MKEIICPYCHLPVLNFVKAGGEGAHYRVCRKQNCSTNPSFVDVAIYNFGEAATKEFLYNKIINEQIPIYEIDQLYFDRKAICRRLANFYNIKTPSISEATSTKRSREKYKKTCLEKYGVINSCAAGTPGREKAEKTIKEKYGVINFWCIPNFQDYLKSKLGEKEYHDRKAKRSKNVWANKTAEEKNNWLNKSIRKAILSNNRVPGSNCSKAEIEFTKRLVELGFEIETQFKVFNKKDKFGVNHYYFFDVRLKDTNILIEFNGDYYHANPLIYKEEDIVTFHTKEYLVKEIWERDKLKKLCAEKAGYNIIYIWESEFNSGNFEEILFDKLNMEANFGNFRIEEHQKN